MSDASRTDRLPVPGVVVIPARNEAASVASVVRDVRAQVGTEVIVVDDASSDDTGRLARAAGARVLHMPFRAGAWGATQAGMRYALGRGFRICMTLDADGQHPATALPAIASPVIRGDCDVTIGICPERGSRARCAARRVFRCITGLKLQDVTSGMRAYNTDAMRLLVGREAVMLDYQDVGVLLMLREAGMRAAEVKVRMDIRRNGRSRVYDSWWTVAHYLMQTFVLSLGKWRLSWHLDDMFVTPVAGTDER